MAIIRVPKYRILLAVGFVVVLMLACLQIAAPAQAGAIVSDKNVTQEIPGSASQLPLIAFLGFGMLAGGVISVLNTRPEKRAVRAS